MFLHYMNKSKIINLDNFDCIELKERHDNAAPYKIIITKYSNPITQSAEITIAEFRTLGEATFLYERLQYAWIHGQNVFDL